MNVNDLFLTRSVGFKQSEYAIINTDDPELPIEDNFQLTDQQGLKTTLKLHYT